MSEFAAISTRRAWRLRPLTTAHLLLLGPASGGYFSTPSQMPGAVIEPFFLSDPFEGSVALSINGQEVVAMGIGSAVEQYFVPATTTSAVGPPAAPLGSISSPRVPPPLRGS